MLRKIRIVLAAVFYVLITLLLLDFTGVAHKWLGWMAKMQFLPAVLALNVVVIVALMLLTLAFGRVYCSVICPLGVMQDLISWLHGKKKKNRFTYSAPKNVLRYSVFAVFVVGIALGFGAIVTLLSPYGTYGAIVSNLLQPLYLWGNNALAALAEHYDSYAFYSKEVWIKSVPVFATAIALFAAISVLAWRGGRTYCNTICPVGTLLGFVARFSWLKVHFYADKCKNCGLCTKNCKASCIDFKSHTVDYSRCVTCGNCLDKCSFGALTYAHATPKAKAPDTVPTPTDTTRRAIIVGAAIVGAEAAMAKLKKVDCARRPNHASAPCHPIAPRFAKCEEPGATLRWLPTLHIKMPQRRASPIERPRALYAARNELRPWILPPRVYTMLVGLPCWSHSAHHQG